MADTLQISDQQALTIVISNKEPLVAGDVGALFDAIDRDYSQFSGRHLTIQTLRTGSLTAVLVDVCTYSLATMGAVVTIKEFVSIVRKALDKIKAKPARLGTARSIGSKTVRAIVRTSRSTHAEVSIEYQHGGERVTARLTREEAEVIYIESERVATPERPAFRVAGPKWTDRELAAFAETAALVSEDPKMLAGEGNPAFQLLQIMVKELSSRPGGKERLALISEQLHKSGRSAAARLLETLLSET